MAYDGTDFVPIADEIIGAATDDGYAVDVFAQQRLRGNAYYLNAGRNPATLTLYQGDTAFDTEDTDYPGDRPWSSLEYASGMRVPWYMSAGLNQITLNLMYRVEVPFPAVATAPSAGGDIYFQVRVIDPSGRIMGLFNGTFTRVTVGGSRYACFRLGQIDVPFSAYNATPGYGTVELRIKSEIGDDSTTNVTLTGAGNEFATGGNGDFAYPSSSPTQTSPDVQVLKAPDGTFLELFGVRLNGASAETAFVYPDRKPESSAVFDRYWCTYIQVRSIQIDAQYAADSMAPQPLSGLAAKQPVRASSVFPHAIHPPSLYRRPRCVALGPPGYRPTRIETWPALYHTRFPFATGAAALDLVDESLMLDVDGEGTVTIVLDLISTVYNTDLAMEAGTSDWTLLATLQEFDTADTTWASPTTAGTTTRAVQFKTHPCPRPTAYFWAHRGTNFQLSKWIQHTSQTAPGTVEFPHKEGLLFDGDTALIQRVAITVDASDLSSTLIPVRLTVNAEYVASSLQGFENSTTTSRLNLSCVGFSVWQQRSI